MAHTGSTRLGGHAFNHSQSQDAEAEYDRLRHLAQQEHAKMSSCFDRAHNAYQAHNGAEAHELSQQGHRHQALRDQYNKQASEFIFRENNASGRVDGDTIDLHGQFVEEAEDILEKRIRAAKSQNQTHLHVIVGKGNHSPHHVQKIKPMVEKLCREDGLSYHTEENEGRIYVDLTGGHGGGQPQMQQHPSYTPHEIGKPQQGFDQEGIQEKRDSLANCLKACCIVM